MMDIRIVEKTIMLLLRRPCSPATERNFERPFGESALVTPSILHPRLAVVICRGVFTPLLADLCSVPRSKRLAFYMELFTTNQ